MSVIGEDKGVGGRGKGIKKIWMIKLVKFRADGGHIKIKGGVRGGVSECGLLQGGIRWVIRG